MFEPFLLFALEIALVKKFFIGILVLALLSASLTYYWAHRPIIVPGHASIEFSINPNSSVLSSMQQVADAGVPVFPVLLAGLAGLSGKAHRLKAGSYELKPGTTPLELIDQLVRGEFAQESLSIIEGWTFRQMRQAVAAHPALKHDTVSLSDKELMVKIGSEYALPEGLFFPDTYLFAKGASDLQIYRQAHALLLKSLDEAWKKRDSSVPYKTPYEALVMASIVEKETGQKSERRMIAGVFMNRLKRGMLLQTDPSVIYGMREKFNGNIRKKDLETDTPYNTYTRLGLPPTPIALAGAESVAAVMNPAKTESLYFVARGNGTSQFSTNLTDHNRAVNKYQR